MKKIFIILSILAVSLPICAQQQAANVSTQAEKIINSASYILSANQDAIKWKDTVYYYASKLRRCRYARIAVTLSNISADTLKYVDMSCSTLDIFVTDIKDVRMFQNVKNCFKNNPTAFTVAPYRSVIFDVPIYVFSNDSGPGKVFTPEEFKIGMALIKYRDNSTMFQEYQMILEKKNLIWCKAITVH